MTTNESTKWVEVKGIWDVGPSIVYKGPQPTPGDGYGITLASGAWRNGTVCVGVELSSTQRSGGGILLGFDARTSAYHAVQIAAHDRGYAITEYDPAVGWLGVAHGGHVSTIKPQRRYQLAVDVNGQNVVVQLDGVKVLDFVLRAPLAGDQIGLFAWGSYEVRFDGFVTRARKPKAFVAMPFQEPFDTLYKDVIHVVAMESFEVVRIDEVRRPGIVTEDILRAITEADLVIAEITAPNENVYYEVGYAHAMRKPTILLSQERILPFDLRGHRVILYKDTIGGKRKIEDELRTHVTSVLRNLAHEPLDCSS